MLSLSEVIEAISIVYQVSGGHLVFEYCNGDDVQQLEENESRQKKRPPGANPKTPR